MQDVYLLAAQAEDQLARFEYALALQSYLELSGKFDVRCETTIGWLYDKLGEKNEAKIFYRRAIELGDSYAMHGFAGLCFQDDEFQQAILYYKMAIEAGRLECLFPLAKTYIKIGDLIESRKYLEAALDFDGNPYAKRDLAVLFIKGKFGLLAIIKGIFMYVANFKGLLIHVINEIREDEKMGNKS